MASAVPIAIPESEVSVCLCMSVGVLESRGGTAISNIVIDLCRVIYTVYR